MKVIKRDGRRQDFDLDKIIRSIEAASDDVREPLTESDLHNIAKDIEKTIKDLGREEVLYSDIRKIVLDVLKKKDFKMWQRHI